MPRRLLLLNVVLLAVAAAFAVTILREITEPLPRPMAVRTRPAPPAAAAPATDPATARPAPAAYGVIAARNLFSPTRTESPPTGTAAAKGAPVLPKPNLFGVVIRDGASIAYLEDPTTKRVAGYRLGDAVAGGTVKSIDSDHVVLTRPDGPVDVRLHDPSKPRIPAVPVQPANFGAPGAPGVAPPSAPPFVPPPVSGFVPPLPPTAVQQPGIQQAPPVTLQPRRPLPGNLIRRVPPGSPNDASP